MEYVFRIQNIGDLNMQDWTVSSVYDSNVIRNIRDTLETGIQSKAATSIPSPFARMHLFETAFHMVNKNHLGSSLYHMLVSDCLDLLNLIFMSDNNAHINFKRWDKQTQLAKFTEPSSPLSHKLLAKSL